MGNKMDKVQTRSGPCQDGQGPESYKTFDNIAACGGVFTFVPHAGNLKAKKAGARTWK
jgi:hypothetical protein